MTPKGSRPPDAPLRVGLFNVKYSPNLGDGLLSESLEAELAEIVPGLTTRAFDLAGRDGYSDGGRMRGTALRLLQSSPTPVRHTVVKALFGQLLRRRIRPAWGDGLDAIDVAVVGGGNLFDDADLNFPLKIDAALAEVRARGVPAAIFGVGVSDNWSAAGEALFRTALTATRPVYASVRDKRSAAIWARRLGPAGLDEARIVRDPGILVARHVRGRKHARESAPLVGLGVTHPVLLSYHADEPTVAEADLTAWYLALLRGCLDSGWRVSVFTNGSPEDENYLRSLRAACSERGDMDGVAFEPRFRTPSDLAAFISGLDLMMAHRLHANIAAYSYRVPTIGFSWDVKLKSFLTEIDRGDFLCAAGLTPVDDALALAASALREGVAEAKHQKVIAAARADVRVLAEVLLATRTVEPAGRLAVS